MVGLVVFGALAGWVVMTLWNWLIPALFTGPVIGFWQALGILVLSKILLVALKAGKAVVVIVAMAVGKNVGKA